MAASAKIKKVLGFLFMKSAFSKRNFTSVALVLFFMLIYKLSGGGFGFDSLPDLQRGTSFGGVESGSLYGEDGYYDEAQADTEDAGVIEDIFGKREADNAEQEDTEVFEDEVIDEVEYEEEEREDDDSSLGSLEERLKNL